jgi:hypothetical protein
MSNCFASNQTAVPKISGTNSTKASLLKKNGRNVGPCFGQHLKITSPRTTTSRAVAVTRWIRSVGRRSQMKVLVHKDVIKATAVDCLECHRNLGHVYNQDRTTREGGWYMEAQAATGGKTYAQSCARVTAQIWKVGPVPR